MGNSIARAFWQRFKMPFQIAHIAHRMPRPCLTTTVQFRRKLTPAQRAVILAAGDGDMTRGFHEILAVFSQARAAGYRPGMPLESIGLVTIGSVKDSASD